MVDVGLHAGPPAVRLIQLLDARRQLALGARRPPHRLVVLAAVALAQLGLLREVPALDLGDAVVLLLVALGQLGPTPPLRHLQLGDAPRLLLGDVALPALLGRRHLFLLPAAHAPALVALVALLRLRPALGPLPPPPPPPCLLPPHPGP